MLYQNKTGLIMTIFDFFTQSALFADFRKWVKESDRFWIISKD
jgi:hypothetical protein